MLDPQVSCAGILQPHGHHSPPYNVGVHLGHCVIVSLFSVVVEVEPLMHLFQVIFKYKSHILWYLLVDEVRCTANAVPHN